MEYKYNSSLDKQFVKKNLFLASTLKRSGR